MQTKELLQDLRKTLIKHGIELPESFCYPPEKIVSGQLWRWLGSSHQSILLVLGSKTRLKCALVNNWTWLVCFDKQSDLKVRIDAQGIINTERMEYIGELNEFLDYDGMMDAKSKSRP